MKLATYNCEVNSAHFVHEIVLKPSHAETLSVYVRVDGACSQQIENLVEEADSNSYKAVLCLQEPGEAAGSVGAQKLLLIQAGLIGSLEE